MTDTIQNDTERAIAAVFIAAGWAPHFGLRGYSKPAGRGWLVGGAPDPSKPLVTHMKVTEKEADSPDTPDDPIAAAHWLVARFPVETVSKPEETPEHEAHEETGAEEGLVSEISDSGMGRGFPDAGDDSGSEEWSGDRLSPAELANMDGEGEGLENEPSIFDADFYEPDAPAIEGADLGAEILDEGQASAFIFGDNLEQQRTSAIGLVVQAALTRLPPPIEYAQLSELRNFTMGVSEGRWPDNPDKREELDTLEATERLRRAVEAARDTKVAALLSATREELEAFDVEAGWP